MAGKLVIWVTCFQRLMSRPFLSEDNPRFHIYARVKLWAGTKWQEAVHFSLYMVVLTHNQTDRATGAVKEGEREKKKTRMFPEIQCAAWRAKQLLQELLHLPHTDTGGLLWCCWCGRKSMNRFTRWLNKCWSTMSRQYSPARAHTNYNH